MTVKSYNRGHETYYNQDQKKWLYSDDDSPAEVDRPCKRCGEYPVWTNGADNCLRGLINAEGIIGACCGHGIHEGYIMLSDGRRFREEKLDD